MSASATRAVHVRIPLTLLPFTEAVTVLKRHATFVPPYLSKPLNLIGCHLFLESNKVKPLSRESKSLDASRCRRTKNLFSLSNRKLSFSIPYRSGCQWIFDETPLDKYGISIEMPIVKCASPISSFLLQSGIAGNPPLPMCVQHCFLCLKKTIFPSQNRFSA